eukprot:8862396-Pyramimonas_sp.AAC.1
MSAPARTCGRDAVARRPIRFKTKSSKTNQGTTFVVCARLRDAFRFVCYDLRDTAACGRRRLAPARRENIPVAGTNCTRGERTYP